MSLVRGPSVKIEFKYPISFAEFSGPQPPPTRYHNRQMPYLQREPSAYPDELLGEPLLGLGFERWWCLTTTARAEKAVSRRLYAEKVPFYCPTIGKRVRSPSGRLRESFVPLFPSYLFVAGDESSRTAALRTNKISRSQAVADPGQLVQDLRRIYLAIAAGVPLTPEARIATGDRVRVRHGPFAGVEGVVLRREGKTRLLLSVRFIDQGVSLEIDEALLECV